MKKINLVVAGVLAVSVSHLFAQTAVPAAAPAAAAAPAPAPDWTITGNMALSSDYRTRGVSQTDKGPALSGGFDIAHSSGFYIGNWNSNVDSTYYNGANLEMDIWAGFRGTVGDVGYDIGAFYYYYPGSGSGGAGSGLPGIDNKEIYVGASYGPVSARVYIPIGDFFSAEKIYPGTGSADGSYYVDVSGSQSVGDGFTLIAHVGYQKLEGAARITQTSGSVANDYWDWKLGGSYTFSTGYVVSLVYIDTSIDFKPYPSSRNISGATGVLSVSRTF